MRYDPQEDAFLCAQSRRLLCGREQAEFVSGQPVDMAWYRCESCQDSPKHPLLKTDFAFRRFLTRGKATVCTELFFLCLAFNLKKLWMKRENMRLKTHLAEIRVA